MGKGWFWHLSQNINNSIGEGDNRPQLEVHNHAPDSLDSLSEAVPQWGRCNAVCPREAAAFPCKHKAPLVAFFGMLVL